MGRNRSTFTFDIVSVRRYLKNARERLAIIWKNYDNNERHNYKPRDKFIPPYRSAEMITTSKLTAPKDRPKMTPVTFVVGRSVIPIYAMAFFDLR